MNFPSCSHHLHHEKNIPWEHMGMGQNPIPLVNIKIAGKWMFIPLKMVVCTTQLLFFSVANLKALL